MKKRKLKSLNRQLQNNLNQSQEQCQVLQTNLLTLENKLAALTKEKQQIEKHHQKLQEQYAEKAKDFNYYKENLSSINCNKMLNKTLKTIQNQKEQYLCLFSKMQREYLFSLVEFSQKEDQKQMLEQIENIFASL